MRIVIWDEDNNYFYGELENTNVRLWDQSGEISFHGYCENGNLRIYSEQKGYLWGRLEGTDLTLWDDKNNFMWGRLEH